MNECGTVSSELQNTADNLHHLRGVTHRPVKIHTPLLGISFLKAAIISIFHLNIWSNDFMYERLLLIVTNPHDL